MSSRDDVSQSKRYSRIKTNIFMLDILLTGLSLFCFQVFLSNSTSKYAHAVFANFYLACFLYIAVFMLFMYFIGLPLHVYSSFLVERKFNLSNQKFISWIFDEVKSGVLTFVISVLAIETFYLFLRSFPRCWWLWRLKLIKLLKNLDGQKNDIIGK